MKDGRIYLENGTGKRVRDGRWHFFWMAIAAVVLWKMTDN